MTIEAIAAAGGPVSEWAVPRVEALGPEAQVEAGAAADEPSGTSFGEVLAKSVGELQQLQVDAADQAQQLATGQTSDVTSVVMAAERAQLSMQLASTIRTKATEALQDVLRTQV